MQRLSEMAGTALGYLLGGMTGPIARLRRSRMFHPEGHVYEGEFLRADGLQGAAAALARQLEGSLLARFSTAWWKNQREWKDAMGCALRFGWKPEDAANTRDFHQDLLLATIRLPITTPFAPITTNVHDFMRNHYFAVSPFEFDGLGRIKFRLVPQNPGISELPRAASLDEKVAQAAANFTLQIRAARLGSRWHPIGALKLIRKVALDQNALRFSPFHSGKGVHPAGFVNHLRIGAYRASQRSRPA